MGRRVSGYLQTAAGVVFRAVWIGVSGILVRDRFEFDVDAGGERNGVVTAQRGRRGRFWIWRRRIFGRRIWRRGRRRILTEKLERSTISRLARTLNLPPANIRAELVRGA